MSGTSIDQKLALLILVEEAIEYWSKYIPNVEAIGLSHTRHTDRIDGEGVTGGQLMLINDEKWMVRVNLGIVLVVCLRIIVED